MMSVLKSFFKLGTSTMHLIEDLGPALGLHVNLAKCELFSRRGNTSFPPEVRCSLLPNLDIHYLHCSSLSLGNVLSPGGYCLV